MKVTDLLEAKRASTDTPGYDPEAKIVLGTTKDWLARLNATKDDITTAVTQAKELPSFVALTQLGAKVETTARHAANGTFVFSKPFSKPHSRNYTAQYIVYANGQIRSASKNHLGNVIPTRLKTPKPRLVAGDPVASLVKIYDGAFKELANKIKSAQGVKESATDDVTS